MEVRPGYKQTEVGVIPEEWEVSTVSREFENKLGKMLDAERNVGVPKPYLGNKAVQWDRIDIDDLPTSSDNRTDIEKFRACGKVIFLSAKVAKLVAAAIWEAPLESAIIRRTLHRLHTRL